jgi:hypothetical protein
MWKFFDGGLLLKNRIGTQNLALGTYTLVLVSHSKLGLDRC